MTGSLRASRAGSCCGWLAALLVVLAAALGSGAVARAEPHAELRDFLPSGHYVLEVDGKGISGARILHSERAGAYLVITDAFDTAVLVMPRTGCIEAVEADQMTEREDGGIDLKVDASPCNLGKFSLQGADVVFEVKGKPARLKQKPPLIGTHWSETLLEHTPEYGRAAQKYAPGEAPMKILKEAGTEARIQIFFGSWCTFCNRFLPNTIKVEEELKKAGSKLTFEFHGLPPPPAAWSTKEALRMRVRRLPTGLIFIDGKLAGRLEGNDWIKPEVSLARIIH